MRLRPLTLIVLAVLSAGCEEPEVSRPERTVPEGTRPERRAYDPEELVGSAWSLRRLNGDELVDGSRITLRFERNVISGYTDCNSYRSSMQQTGGGAFMTPGPEISRVPGTGDLGNQQGIHLNALSDSATYERTGTS